MRLYLNDHEEETSTAINEELVPELAGITRWYFMQEFKNDYNELNKALEAISFTEEPEY